jgi:four helix bundle protein
MSDGNTIGQKRVQCFEDLIIWQKGIEFAKDIYLLTDRKGIKHDFGLKGQMRDAAVSIPTNIAEGFERRSRKEYLNFLNIAKASAGESRSLLYVALGVGYLEAGEFDVFREKAKFLSGSISNHMKAINKAS